MKDLSKLFARRYSAVNAHDDEAQQQLAMATDEHAGSKMAATCAVFVQNVSAPNTGDHTCPAPATLPRMFSEKQDKQRRKSLKANRSMKPFDVLSTFFNERHNEKRARTPKCAFLLLAIGILAIATAVVVKIIQPYDLIFRWKLIMAEKGEIFNLWEKPPVDLYIKIYLFNITNAAAFLAGHEPMHVEQVGPYVYKEIMTHENVTFNANNTMSTIPSHPLVWQEHMSEGRREDDEVVMLNIAMLAISHLTAKRSFLFKFGLNSLFVSTKSEPIVRMTAKEFMFGYQTSLTTLGNTFLPDWIYFEKVGLIDRMYDFSTDFETFYTGMPNAAISGLYNTYRGSKNLPHWSGDHCSNIEYASDGTKFKSFLESNDTVKFFRKSMCRPINLYREGNERTFGSLKGYNYVFEENAFDNGRINEANKCFCRQGDCQPSGLIDVTECYYGFPISLSLPHFMNGDPGLQTNISGMQPDSDKHSSAFVIQPESGLPLSLSVKVQINMHFKDLSAFPKVSSFSHLTAPMLWFEIMMPKLSDSLDARFNFYLNILPLVNPIGFIGGLVIGIALLVYSVTRATLHLTSFARQATNISESKYARANILSATQAMGVNGDNNVYNPCELKLLEANEKPHPKHIYMRSHGQVYEDRRRQSSFALELEPALTCDKSGGESSDEGNESDTLTLSRNLTSSSSSSMEIEKTRIGVVGVDCGDVLCNDCFELDAVSDIESSASSSAGVKRKQQTMAASLSSSGFASTPASSSSQINLENNSKSNSPAEATKKAETNCSAHAEIV